MSGSQKMSSKHGRAARWAVKNAPAGGSRSATSGASAIVRQAETGQFVVSPSRVEELRSRGFSNDEIYSIVAPRRTLARRKEKGEELTVSESDRVHRLERISEMADRVFGSRKKAQGWLRSEIIALDGARPIDLLQSETGAHLVEQELTRIDFGILA